MRLVLLFYHLLPFNYLILHFLSKISLNEVKNLTARLKKMWGTPLECRNGNKKCSHWMLKSKRKKYPRLLSLDTEDYAHPIDGLIDRGVVTWNTFYFIERIKRMNFLKNKDFNSILNIFFPKMWVPLPWFILFSVTEALQHNCSTVFSTFLFFLTSITHMVCFYSKTWSSHFLFRCLVMLCGLVG